MSDPMETYIDYLPMPKMGGAYTPGIRIAVWDGRHEEFWGTGAYLGEEYYHSPQFGPGTYPKLELDKEVSGRKIIYGCECWWQPLEDIPTGIKQSLGIKE